MKLLKLLLTAAATVCITGAFAQVGFGDPQLINDDWTFTTDDPDMKPTRFVKGAKWRKVQLPHDWSVEGSLSPSLASGTGYLPGGVGHYRKNLEIPASKQGEKVYIYFEGVYNRSKVILNGNTVGSRPNGYISFMYDLTPYVNFGGDNLLEVVVDHSRYIDSRWYSGSGIYRNVWLVYADQVHIAQWGVFAYPRTATAKKGELAVTATVENGSDKSATIVVTHELFDRSGKLKASAKKQLKVEAGGKQSTDAVLAVKSPELWSLESPALYKLVTTVSGNGRVIDRTETVTGFREMRFDPDKGFFLNGQNIKMKGVCLHHDAGVLGAAVPPEVWERRLLVLKSLGVNAVRTSHNPQAPDLYNLCDRLGILVLNEAYDEWEFPKRKWIEGWNQGQPGFDGSYDIFAEWGDEDLRDFVLRDRNHVSVFAWSIGNEVDYPNDPYSHPMLDGDGDFTQHTFGGYLPDAPDAMRLGDIAERLARIVRENDPGRPVTAGLAGVTMSNETGYPYALDIAGYNYTESRYILDHERYPERVIYGSENRHDYAAWKAVRDNEHIFGQFLWTGIDYLGESHEWPSRGFGSGIIDLAGFVKPRGYFRKALWMDEPTAYLGTYRIKSSRDKDVSIDAPSVWNYTEGELIRVVCYTNAASATLYLNGNKVGDNKPHDDNSGIIRWDIPFAAGTLEVKAHDADGNQTASYTIRTSGPARRLEVSAYEGTINSESGVAQIEVQALDANGIPVMLADDEITCTIEGPGTLLGMEAANNTDMSDYTDNVHRLYQGRMIVYVKAKGAGEIKVNFTSNWIEPATFTVNAK